MSKGPATVTKLLGRYHAGERQVLDELLGLIYTQLHSMAKARMRKERSDHTLRPTALVNEAFLRLLEIKEVNWENRTHFFAMAATVMRRVLVEHARARGAAKRGGSAVVVSFDEALHSGPDADPDLLVLDELLDRLAGINERQSKVVELRYFAGLTVEEIADVLTCSADTVKRDWQKARLWLYHAIKAA